MSLVDYVAKEKALLQSIGFTQDTYNNWQRRAIAGILLRNTSRIPYILFGPPGTGKTTTLVEATIQLVRASDTNRILVCTPSNAAADHFTLSLLRNGALDQCFIFRVYSNSQLPDEKPKEILPVCHTSSEDNRRVFKIPSDKEFLSKHRVFVMTLSCSTYFVNAGLKGKFSHIIVDEAGQAHEIETMVPLCRLGNAKTRFVLAGDPKQLGPVDIVKLTKNLNFDRSMMERLLNIKFYADFDCRFICMLRDNYRAHKSLVDFPSKMFYNNQLVAAIPASERNSLSQWSELPNRGFPMFWYSVKGNQEKKRKGTSLKNCAEAKVVVLYVKRLISAGVTPDEIGVISPYKYQVDLIRKKLATFSKDLTVDSVEKYQGSERKVIIVSTVRTKGMGFLDCGKRLNTTITRAKELLIIIGNDNNLKKNEMWRQFIEHFHENNAIIERAKSQKSLEDCMKKLSVKNSNNSKKNSNQSTHKKTKKIRAKTRET